MYRLGEPIYRAIEGVLTMSIETIAYRAHATATGGREGNAKSSDGALDVKLSTPKELGGPGGDGTNPEQLFAAGYSACFLGALKHVASQERSSFRTPPRSTVTSALARFPPVLASKSS